MALAPDAPRLVDWVTLTEAADILGVSKQAVHKMVTLGHIKTLHLIGNRPVYVVSEAEIVELGAARAVVAQARRAKREAVKVAEGEFVNGLVRAS